MFIKSFPFFRILALFTLIAMFSTQSWAQKYQEQPTSLSIANVSFFPTFITVGKHHPIKIAVTLPEDSPVFSSDELVLEQQRLLFNGKSGYFPIAILRDDGKHSDHEPADSNYTGTASFHEEVSGTVQLRVVAKMKHSKHILVSPLFSVPVQHACGPTGIILPVQIFEGKERKHRFGPITFNVPESEDGKEVGHAILRLVNGARIGAPKDERFKSAQVYVNGKKVTIAIDKKHKQKEVDPVNIKRNVIEVPISLVSGKTNRLDINRAIAKSDQRLSARIDVCPDTLKLTPIPDTQLIGQTIQTEAKLTGLGVPIENAGVQFIMKGLGPNQKTTVTTSSSGIATSLFLIPATGKGKLIARVIGIRHKLLEKTPFSAVAQSSIVLGQGRSEVTINTQESLHSPFFLYYVNNDGISRHINFEQTVMPATGGITLTTDSVPEDGFVTTGSDIFSVEETIQGMIPGEYTINSKATIKETGETTSSTLTVKVVDSAAPEPLVLGSPSANPPAVSPTDNVKVTFLSLVSGTSTPPKVLYLDQVDSNGQLLRKDIAQLKDDGKGDDENTGDFAYTGSVILNTSDVGERNYRVRAEYIGTTVISGTVTFGVTPFPLEARPSDLATLIKDPNNGSEIFANEVVAEFLPDVSSDRITEIATAAGTKAVGAIPTLRTYLLEIPGNESFSGVQNAIATLQSFSEVQRAYPNDQPIPLGFSDNDLFNSQSYLQQINAPQAWEIAGGGDSNKATVAIFDKGVFCIHEDLLGQCILDDPLSNSAHATALAGIIAAVDNTKGIVGVAYGTKIYDYNIDSSFDTQGKLIKSLSTLVKIVNISQRNENIFNGINQIKNSNRLVVLAAGNPNNASCYDNTNFPPASDFPPANDGILVIGATNNNNDQLATGFKCSDGSSSCCSNRYNVELYAPGKNIWTTDTSTAKYNNSYSGTSFASALTSGAAAVLWASKPTTASLSAVEVENRLKSKAKIINLGANFGTGSRLDLFAAVAAQTVTVDFKSDDADFRNIFGYYFTDTLEAHILLDNVDKDTNEAKLDRFQKKLNLTADRANKVKFFIIPGGRDSNPTLFPTSTTTIPTERKFLVFKDTTNNKWRVKDPAINYILRGRSGDAFFSDKNLNSDGIVHVRNLPPGSSPTICASGTQTSNLTNYVACWEDLEQGVSDLDYNDAVFSIVTTNQ